MSYLTTDLINGVKRRANIPTANATFGSADFLSLADSEIRTSLLPKILSVRESYYSFDVNVPLSQTNNVYAIPTRAVGAKLQAVYLYNSSLQSKYNLNLVTEDEIYLPSSSPVSGPCFYFKGNNIVLVPLPMSTNYDTLKMTIFIRPSQLVDPTTCAQITSINTGTNTITCSSVPSGFSTSSVYDLVKGNPHYDFYVIDQTPTVVVTGTSGTIQFSSLPTGLSVGDFVCPAQTSPVVQIPTEFQPVLEQRVANSCLRAQGMASALQAGIEALKEVEEATYLLINPRAEREPKKIRNNSSLLRRNTWY